MNARLAATLAAVLGLTLFAAGAAAAPARAHKSAPRATLAERVRADSIGFARGITRTRFDSLNAEITRDIAEARRLGDTRALQKLRGLQGIAYSLSGDGKSSIAALDESLQLVEAATDTTWILSLLRYRAYSAGMLGRFDEQRTFAERLIALAEVRNDERFIAVGHNFLGWIASRRGQKRDALKHLERAVEAQRRLGNETDEAVARTAYGNALMDLGEYEAARRSYDRELDIARRLKLGWTEAQVWNDLSRLEREVGDPGLTPEYLRRAYDLHRQRGETPDAAAALANLAIAEFQVGRTKNAEDVARQGLDMAQRRGFQRQRGDFLLALAMCDERAGRRESAERGFRAALALGDTAGAGTRAVAVLGVSRLLGARGQLAEALALIEPVVPVLAPQLPPDDAALLRLGLAARLNALKRHDEALQTIRPVIATVGQLQGNALGESAYEDLALTYQRLGRMTEARAAYDTACMLWEQRRSRTRSQEWRSSPWSAPWNLTMNNTAFLLDVPASSPESTRVAAAWERLQRFRARTLLERMSGRLTVPARSTFPTAAFVQSRLLNDGELLLEWVTNDAQAILFAFTRTERHAFRLDRPGELGDRIRNARDFLSAPPRGRADLAAQEAVARELAKVVFGPALPMVGRASSLLLVPDGEIHLVPFSALILRSAPLAVSHTLALVPSVAVLAESRTRVPPSLSRGLLAVARGAGNTRLAGATSEVNWLASAFDGVDHRGPTDAAVTPALLTDFDALHFAGHTTLDDRYPWRSGIDLGGADATNPELLRAEAIAVLPLHARLVVLSSCETAGGAITSGEGVSGLSTAFLAAGVRTVVASLWPVDDRATETLMREFYRRLATGYTAAAALREAQALVRRNSATRHPHYWAGFEVLGDGRMRLPLTPTAPWKKWLRG